MTQRGRSIIDWIALVLVFVGCALMCAFLYPTGWVGGLMGIGTGVLYVAWAFYVLAHP